MNKNIFIEETKMKTSLQLSDNTKIVLAFKKLGLSFINAELYKGKMDKHKFEVDQRLRLIELEDYPEFNGEEIEITSIREDGPFGKAYYFKASNPLIAAQLNWTYEYRLKELLPI